VEQLPELGWDVFEKGKNPVGRVFVPKNVEYKPVSGCEGISVCRNPTFQVRSKHLVMMRLECQKNLSHNAITLKAISDYINLM